MTLGEQRRGAVVLGLGVLGWLAGPALAEVVLDTHRAEATLVLAVPPTTPDDTGEAARLAGTYAESLPSSPRFLAALVGSTGADADEVAERLVMTVVDDTSVIHVSYAAGSEAEVLATLGAVSAVVTGSSPPEPVVVGTVEVLSVPADAAVRTALPAGTAAPLGAVLGLGAGGLSALVVQRRGRQAPTA